MAKTISISITNGDVGDLFGEADSMEQAAILLAMARGVKGYSWCQHSCYITDHLDPEEKSDVIEFVETLLGHLKYVAPPTESPPCPTTP